MKNTNSQLKKPNYTLMASKEINNNNNLGKIGHSSKFTTKMRMLREPAKCNKPQELHLRLNI